ncbi:MAG: metal-dependent transcriptional regulator [Chloroflexia bacterium]|nr:metal-dependent transcriptional regulator [Chloroflexia bacterium]
MSSQMRGEAVEDYLKGIYDLSARSRDDSAATSGRVATQDLADHVGVSAASTSRMLKHLDKLGYVEHEPYHGATLTEAGKKIALEVIRHHRLIELYLHDALGYSWDQVHEEAERLEHYISEGFEARIFEILGEPAVDPHGDIIPTLEGALPPGQERSLANQLSLSEVPADTWAVVHRVPSADAEKLRYMQEIGLVPGAHVEVLERIPFGGGLRFRAAEGTERVIGLELAAEVRVVHQ